MRVPDRGRRIGNISPSSPTEDDLAARRHDDLSHDLELLLGRLAESREAIVRLLAARSGDDETVAGEETDVETVTEGASRDDETVAEDAEQGNEIRYPEPSPMGRLRPLRHPVAAAEPETVPPMEASPPKVIPTGAKEPQASADVEPHQLPSSLRRPGPPALELALIYREIARNGEEVLPQAAPAEVVYQPGPEGPDRAAGRPSTAGADRAPSAAPVVKIPAQREVPVPAQPVHVTKTDGSATAVKRRSSSRRRLLAVVLTAVGAVVLLTTLVSVLPSIVSAL